MVMIEFVDGFLSKNLYTFCVKPEEKLAAYGQAIIKKGGGTGGWQHATRVFSCLNF